MAVLWILAALATLASIYSVYASNAAVAAHINDDQLRIRASTLSAIELTAYKLMSAPEDARPPQGAFAFHVARSQIDVTFVTEGARIDLNAAPKEMLAGLFTVFGASPEEASVFADRIVGWRKKGLIAGQNDEADAYKAAGYDYAPRQAPFRNVLELSLVRDLPKPVVERILPFVTIFNGKGAIDVRVADSAVLFALPRAVPEQIQKVLQQRAQSARDGEALLNLLGPARANATTATSPATRVHVDVRLDNGRVARAEVVILILQGENDPYRVLSWRDDVDGLL